jgi:hypothetical protein
MINDRIDAVINMQEGTWTDKQIADQVSQFFPKAVEDISRKELLRMVKRRVAERVNPEAERAIWKFITEDHPEVGEFMKKNRTVKLGDALRKFGLLTERPKH